MPLHEKSWQKVVAVLTRQERLIVMLRYVDRLRLSEIGQVLEISPFWAGLLLLSIRSRLRAARFLRPWDERPAKSPQPAQAELPPYDPAAYPVFWHGWD